MAEVKKKIFDLTPKPVPEGTDEIEGQETGGGASVKFSLANIFAALGGIKNVVEDTTPQAGGAFDMNSQQMNWSKGSNIASAATLPNITDGNYAHVTGTTTITVITTTGKVGTHIKHVFDGILTLTNSAAIILPGAANITTAAGDVAEWVEDSAGNFKCTTYTKADGTAVVSGGGGEWTLLSTIDAVTSSSIDFDNLIDGTYDNYVVIIESLKPSTDGAQLKCRIGTGATPTYQTSLYQYHSVATVSSSSAYSATNSASTSAIHMVGNINIGNDAALTSAYVVNIHTGTAANVHWSGTTYATTGSDDAVRQTGSGTWDGTGPITSVRFYPSGGNFTGKFSLYGINS